MLLIRIPKNLFILLCEQSTPPYMQPIGVVTCSHDQGLRNKHNTNDTR